jgi:Domain of unknown function (DUF4111)/Nucleotidyltransferase domain
VTGAGNALRFAHRLAATCSHELGEALTSVIVHGSLVLGGFNPERSDIDLLAIVTRPLTDSEVESLARALSAAQAGMPCPVDFRVVAREIAADPRVAPPVELYVRLRPGGPPRIEARRQEEPDLLVELSVCREHGRALLGASPREVIGAVPHRWVLRAGDAQLARWESLTDDAPYAALMVLTACRIWRFSEERTHCSKSAAGLWALERDPSLQAVRDALRLRAGHAARVEPAEIGRLLRLVRAQIMASESS